MRPPSASASRSARASRFRVQSSSVSAKHPKVGQIGKLFLLVNGAFAYVVSLVRPRP